MRPYFNVKNNEASFIISYEKERSGLTVEASKETQFVTFSSQLDEKNRVSLSFTNTGDQSLSVVRREVGMPKFLWI